MTGQEHLAAYTDGYEEGRRRLIADLGLEGEGNAAVVRIGGAYYILTASEATEPWMIETSPIGLPPADQVFLKVSGAGTIRSVVLPGPVQRVPSRPLV